MLVAMMSNVTLMIIVVVKVRRHASARRSVFLPSPTAMGEWQRVQVEDTAGST